MPNQVNDSCIRVAGHELRAAMRLLEQARSIITDTLKTATTELAYADPCSDQGKSLEHIVIALGRLSDGIGTSARIYDCTETMKTFGIGAAPDPRTEPAMLYPEKEELRLCHP